MIDGIIFGVNNIFNIFFFLIILRIFLSWIPSVDWDAQPWVTLVGIVDPFLNIFKRIIPPMGGLDFSPIIALLVLQLINNILIYLLTMLR